MSQESYSWGSGRIKMSRYEIRQQQKKALQSYQQITSIKQSSDKELHSSIDEAEKELEQFIISDKDKNGK